jgi:hypothetical protein
MCNHTLGLFDFAHLERKKTFILNARKKIKF